MHPIEHLRHVARAGMVDPGLLAREAASALIACAASPAELVVACRRLLDRHPAAAPLWWVASTALTATDPRPALLAAVRTLDDDPTDAYAAEMRREGASCLVRAWALSTGEALVTRDGSDEADIAHTDGRPVWLVAGVGSVLPSVVFEAAARRALEAAGPGFSTLAPSSVTGVVTPDGPLDFGDAVVTSACPVAPELLGPSRR